MVRNPNRRKVLAVSGVTIGALAGCTGLAQEDSGQPDGNLSIGGVNAEAEVVTLVNSSNSDIDLSDYTIDWEYEGGTTQTDRIGDGDGNATIPANGQLTIASGYGSTTADVVFDYDAARINNDGDVIALIAPDDSVVDTYDAGAGNGGDEQQTITWDESGQQGSEHATQDCGGEYGYWHWVWNSGGGTLSVTDATLTVEFEDGTSTTVSGYHPSGSDTSSNVHFDAYKEDGGTVVGATASTSGEFGNGNVVLTISEGLCVPDEGDDGDNGDEGDNGDDGEGDDGDDGDTPDDGDDGDNGDTPDDSDDGDDTDEGDNGDDENGDDSEDGDDGDDTDEGEDDDSDEGDTPDDGGDGNDGDEGEGDDGGDTDDGDDTDGGGQGDEGEGDDEDGTTPTKGEVDIHGACYKDKKGKAQFRVENHGKTERTFTWKVLGTTQTGTVSVAMKSSETIWVTMDTDQKLGLYCNGDRVATAKVNTQDC